MRELSTGRFAAELILQSLFFLSLLSDRPLVTALGAISLVVSCFVGTPSAELHREVSWNLREFLTSLLLLLAIGAAVFALWDRPVLIILLWLASVALACWRRFKGLRPSSRPSNP